MHIDKPDTEQKAIISDFMAATKFLTYK